jgi:8-oxo-dGTP pyrophosphatase MutT (NUDIX family)
MIPFMSSAPNLPPDAPRPAATVILARESAGAPQILLMKRGAGASFMPGAYVFAGGAVDPSDATEAAYALSADFPDERASRRLNVPSHGLSYYVAAAREAFEECGLLMAYEGAHEGPGISEGRGTSEGHASLVDLTSWDEARLHAMRNQLGRHEIDMAQLCRAHGWRLALAELHYFAHWITPPGMKQLFDTRFFLCRAPDHQRASLASGEMSELVWRSAAAALDEYEAGKLRLVFATREMLKQIADFARIDSLLEYARQPREITTVVPVFPPATLP